jgi:hypothetical protein
MVPFQSIGEVVIGQGKPVGLWHGDMGHKILHTGGAE